MKFDRKSIRLKDWDYSQGSYFVTICIEKWRGRPCAYPKIEMAKIENGYSYLNDFGEIVAEEWIRLKDNFGIDLDEYMIMPDHIHGIIGFNNRATTTLGDIIGAFKSKTSVAYIYGVNNLSWPRFEKRLWHRNYYERVIRNYRELLRIRNYIKQNPKKY